MMRTQPSRYQVGYRTPDGQLKPCHASDSYRVIVGAILPQMVSDWRRQGVTNGSVRQLGELTGRLDVGLWETGTRNFVCLGQVVVERNEDALQTFIHFDQSFELLEAFRASYGGKSSGRRARQLDLLREHLLPWDPERAYMAISVWISIETQDNGQTFHVTLNQPYHDEDQVREGLDTEEMIGYLGQLLRRRIGG